MKCTEKNHHWRSSDYTHKKSCCTSHKLCFCWSLLKKEFRALHEVTWNVIFKTREILFLLRQHECPFTYGLHMSLQFTRLLRFKEEFWSKGRFLFLKKHENAHFGTDIKGGFFKGKSIMKFFRIILLPAHSYEGIRILRRRRRKD